MSFNLTYLYRIKIRDKDAGLEEPSGLVLDPGGDGFWTVSDDTKMAFWLDLDGKLRKDRSIKTDIDGLEGITTDPAGKNLYAVCEDKSRILKLDIEKAEVVAAYDLESMKDWNRIAAFFEGGNPNKGLEGIAWDNRTNTPYVMKEGEPGLLIALTADLEGIDSYRCLDGTNGFVDPGVHHDPGIPADKVDFSDICHDASRGAFWIISDKAKRIYLYDPTTDAVLHSSPLGYSEKGRYEEIEKAEGVSFDARSTRLYIVSDKTAELYVYEVRP